MAIFLNFVVKTALIWVVLKKYNFWPKPPTPDAQCRFLLEVKQMPQWVVSSEVLTAHKVWRKLLFDHFQFCSILNDRSFLRGGFSWEESSLLGLGRVRSPGSSLGLSPGSSPGSSPSSSPGFDVSLSLYLSCYTTKKYTSLEWMMNSWQKLEKRLWIVSDCTCGSAKTAAVGEKVYKLIAPKFIVLETFCRSINH